MAEGYTAAGAAIYIGTAPPTTFTKAGYEAVTWTEIGEVTDIPQFGKVYTSVTYNPLSNRGVVKRKGSYDNGSHDIAYALVRGEDGQDDLRTALDSDAAFPFKIVTQDDTHIYYMAQVMSAPVTIGTIDNIVMANTTLDLTSESDILFEDGPGTA